MKQSLDQEVMYVCNQHVSLFFTFLDCMGTAFFESRPMLSPAIKVGQAPGIRALGVLQTYTEAQTFVGHTCKMTFRRALQV